MEQTSLKWLPIPSFEGLYEINDLGEIRSLHKRNKGKQISSKTRRGYITVQLCKDAERKTLQLHRLLAEVFIPNLNNKPYVNHKNGNKLDNSLNNLEWVTHSENMKHAYKHGLAKGVGYKIEVINTETGEIFPSIKEAAEYFSFNYSTCKNYLEGDNPNITFLKRA